MIDNSYPLETPVFSKFFNGVDPHKVKSVLTGIAAGSSLFLNDQLHRPKIGCSNPDLPEFATSWAYCWQPNPPVFAMRLNTTPWVFLCPRVFREPRLPTHDNCVGQPFRGAFSTGQGLGQNQFSHLFHELVHLYLDGPGLTPEIYGIWAAIDLPPSESVENPSNYAFYLASRSSRLVV